MLFFISLQIVKKTKDMNFNFKALLPHLLALGIFLTISIAYFHPALEGYTIVAHDVKTYRGMSKELIDFRKDTGTEALWTNSMFGGMPATQISVEAFGLGGVIGRIIGLGLPHPLNKFFISLLGFYILLLSFKVDFKLSILGAIAFAFSSYFIVLFQAGHLTKSLAIAYMAPTLAGVVLLYRGKVFLGAGLFGLSLALELMSSHLQITYYLIFIIFFYVLSQFVKYILEKRVVDFIKYSSLLLLVVVFSVAVNMVNLWGTIEYGKYTTRGKSELVKENSSNQTSGLDRDYITAWSYGTGETFSLFLPFVKGGGSQTLAQLHPEKVTPSFLEGLGENIVSPAYQKEVYSRLPNESAYWGNQGFTSGNVYVGIIIFFLFILSLFYVKGIFKWFLLGVTILTIMLSWGKNLMWFTNLFLDYLPGYDKFRSPSMILVVAELIMPLLAVLFLDYLIKHKEEIKGNIKKYYVSTGSFVLFLVVLMALPETFFNFFPNGQGSLTLEYLKQAQPDMDANQRLSIMNFYNGEYYPMVKAVRISIYQSDIFRALVFVLLTSGIIYLYITDKIKSILMIVVLGVLISIDLISVDLNYLNNDHYDYGEGNWEEAMSNAIPYEAFDGDYYILQQELADKPKALAEIERKVNEAKAKSTGGLSKLEIDAINFGVLNKYTDFRVYSVNNPFNESRTSFLYKSLGGYHGAKLKRYQEVIDSCLSKNNQEVLNMLNAKYIVQYEYDKYRKQNGTKILQINPNALGNAWFVQKVKFVDSPNEELEAMKIEKGFKASKVAIVDKRFKNLIDPNFTYDSLASIKLISYAPNDLVYESEANSKQVAIFSEIYYDLGWKAYVDGKEVEYFRANYILRGLEIPQGKHKIEFKYALKSYDIGTRVQPVAVIIILLLLGFGVYQELKNKEK